MSTPCENCGSDLRVCVDCDLYNGKYIEIPDNATNGDMIKAMFPTAEVYNDVKESKIVTLRIVCEDFVEYIDFYKVFWNAPYQKGGK